MIAGALRGAGGRALRAHLANTEANEVARPGASRGLVSTSIENMVAEIEDLASHARSRRPLYHVHADPEHAWADQQWDAYWTAFEREFGLENHAFAEAVHVKNGREHRHRVYSLVRPDGTCVRLSHDHARREKLSRLAEVATGARIVPGAHNLAVAAALEREGRLDVVEQMRLAGAIDVERPRALLTPTERQQQERTGWSKDHAGADLLAAWRASDSGPAFVAALQSRGIRLAQGDQAVVAVNAHGHAWPLQRTLSAAAKAAGAPLRAAAVNARLRGLTLPALEALRSEPAPAVVAATTNPASDRRDEIMLEQALDGERIERLAARTRRPDRIQARRDEIDLERGLNLNASRLDALLQKGRGPTGPTQIQDRRDEIRLEQGLDRDRLDRLSAQVRRPIQALQDRRDELDLERRLDDAALARLSLRLRGTAAARERPQHIDERLDEIALETGLDAARLNGIQAPPLFQTRPSNNEQQRRQSGGQPRRLRFRDVRSARAEAGSGVARSLSSPGPGVGNAAAGSRADRGNSERRAAAPGVAGAAQERSFEDRPTHRNSRAHPGTPGPARRPARSDRREADDKADAGRRPLDPRLVALLGQRAAEELTRRREGLGVRRVSAAPGAGAPDAARAAWIDAINAREALLRKWQQQRPAGRPVPDENAVRRILAAEQARASRSAREELSAASSALEAHAKEKPLLLKLREILNNRTALEWRATDDVLRAHLVAAQGRADDAAQALRERRAHLDSPEGQQEIRDFLERSRLRNEIEGLRRRDGQAEIEAIQSARREALEAWRKEDSPQHQHQHRGPKR
jgi:hypothetical protein